MSAAGPKREPADARERLVAATTFDRNLCVTAGAGSGKTSLLIERMLTALLERGVAIERIVAITFTEKAAAEMRDRLQRALEEIARALAADGDLARAAGRLQPDGAIESDAVRTLLRLAANRIDPALVLRRAVAARDGDGVVTTIHAFALRLVQRHPLESGLPAGVVPDIGDGFRRHVADRLPLRLAERLADGAPERAAFERLLRRVTLGQLAELVERIAWLPRIAADADERGLVRRAYVRELERLARELAARKPAAATRGKLLARWEQLVSALVFAAQQLAASGDDDLPPSFDAAMSDAIGAKLEAPKALKGDDRFARDLELAERAQRLLRGLATAEEAAIRELLAAVRPLALQLRDDFTRSGFITADGMLAACVELLAGHPAVRADEARAIELLLVDEFQDTDPLQCEIVLQLCEPADAPPERGSAPRLAPDKLFVVGDPKQSIYRFRGADLETYAAARTLLLEQGGAELSLSTNFRSVPGLLAPLNRLFAAWFSAQNEFEPEYAPLVAHRTDGGERANVEIWTVARAAAPRSAPERRRAEGDALAAEIEGMHAAGTPYGEIVVLLRSLSNVGLYAQPLRARTIPFVLAGGRTFVQRSEVGELASLLIAAADPDDAIACLGALRSTLLAVPDAEIHDAVADGTPLLWPRLAERGSPALRRAVQWLVRANALIASEPAEVAVARIVDAGCLLPIAAAARDGDQRIANLRKLAGLVTARAQELALPLADVVRDLLARQESVDGDAESSLADEAVDAVRLLTIHSAKGLEFPIVIVADLARDDHPRSSTKVEAALLRVDGGGALAVSVPGAALCNRAQVLRRERERAHAQAESKRLLYVALTRAKERLVLLNGGDDDAPWIEPLRTLGYDPRSPPADGAHLAGRSVLHRIVRGNDDEVARETGAGLATAELAAAVTALRAAVTSATTPERAFERPSQHADDDAIGGRDEEERDGALRGPGRAPRDLARCVGSACHLALARSGPTAQPDAATIAAAAEAATEPGVDRARVAAEAQALLAAAPARALLQALAGVRTLARELPLTLARDGRLWRGSADLVFEEGEGAGRRVVVADWKSDQEGDPVALARRHRGQLEIYRDALQKAWRLAEPPAIELLLLRHGRRLAL